MTDRKRKAGECEGEWENVRWEVGVTEGAESEGSGWRELEREGGGFRRGWRRKKERRKQDRVHKGFQGKERGQKNVQQKM